MDVCVVACHSVCVWACGASCRSRKKIEVPIAMAGVLIKRARRDCWVTVKADVYD